MAATPAKRRVALATLVLLAACVRDGQLFFADDLYDRDDRLEEKMDSVRTVPLTAQTR